MEKTANDIGLTKLSLEEEADLLAAIFENATEGIALIDPYYQIRAANKSFAQQMMISMKMIIKAKIEKVILPKETLIAIIVLFFKSVAIFTRCQASLMLANNSLPGISLGGKA